MSIQVRRPTQDHIAALENLCIDLRTEQIKDRAIIAQTLNVRRVQRQYAATHAPLDLIAMRRAQDVLDDLLEPMTAIWPPPPSDLITDGGEP